MNAAARMFALLCREPLATSAVLTLGTLYVWHELTITGVMPLPFGLGPEAIETVAEVWGVSGLPAFALASRYGARAGAVLAAAIGPPVVVHLAIFIVFGSLISAEYERTWQLAIIHFAIPATAFVGSLAAVTLMAARRARVALKPDDTADQPSATNATSPNRPPE